jgi:hypothetical protein
MRTSLIAATLALSLGALISPEAMVLGEQVGQRHAVRH